MNQQEEFWAGQFGNDYIKRNDSQKLLESNIALFSDIMCKTRGVKTILELGCNIGLNLQALQCVDPSLHLAGVDINRQALERAPEYFRGGRVPDFYHSTIDDFAHDEKFDLVFTKGVLIHVAPEQLPVVYSKMREMTSKYVLIAEYYNPSPVALNYRGFSGKLWKRDFAGEMLDGYGLRLVDYGFRYHRGEYPQDDITYFLMEAI